MGLFDKLYAEFVDIIEWLDDSRHTMVWRFPRYQNEIKNGAQLIVRPAQKAIFVNEGKVADVFEPGRYELTTQNLPILSTLKGWKHAFNSPFKAEVYFVNTRQVSELKWGTPNPITMRDSEFGPIRLRAFGTYSIRAQDPVILLKELVGTDHAFETDEFSELMRSIILTTFAEVVSTANIPVLDLAANYQILSDRVAANVREKIDDEYGLDITQFNIVNISLPEAVEKALDARSSMGVVGNLDRYQQYQLASSIPDAARNEGGAAGAGIGMGMGFGMANQFAQNMAAPHPQPQAPQHMAPPPVPQEKQFHYVANGQSLGPVPLSNLVARIMGGGLPRNTLIWTAGMAEWQQAEIVPEVKAQLAMIPPPLPKS